MTSLFTAAVALIVLSHAPGLLRLLVARLARMRVERVVLGAIPILRRGKWVIGAIPVGTFVIIAGRDPTGEPTDPALFTARSWAWKLPILLAGPIAFYATAIVAIAVTFVAWGVPVAGKGAIVGVVRPDSPARSAGLQTGDAILSVDGVTITELSEVAPAIGRGGEQVVLEVMRDGVKQRVEVSPVAHKIGIELWPQPSLQPVSVAGAIVPSLAATVDYTAAIVSSLRSTFVGSRKVEYGGPVGIVKVVERSGSQELKNALTLFAIFCVQFGFWFLMPLPIFDGGKLIAQLARKQPSSPAQDHGTIELPRGRMPAPVIVMLILLALAMLGMTLNESADRWEPALLISLIAVGLVMRHPAAWSMSRTISLMSVIGAPLFVWLSLRPTAAWFGLRCPACQRGDGRPAMALKHTYGCLSCGSAWRINR
jgi:regulator of sigma E protease